MQPPTFSLDEVERYLEARGMPPLTTDEMNEVTFESTHVVKDDDDDDDDANDDGRLEWRNAPSLFTSPSVRPPPVDENGNGEYRRRQPTSSDPSPRLSVRSAQQNAAAQVPPPPEFKPDGRHLDAYISGERDEDELRNQFAQWLGARDIHHLYGDIIDEVCAHRAQRQRRRLVRALLAALAALALCYALRRWAMHLDGTSSAAGAHIGLRALALRLAWIDVGVATGGVMLAAPLLLTVWAALLDPLKGHTDAVRRLLSMYALVCVPLLASAGVAAVTAPGGAAVLGVSIVARVAALVALFRWSDLNAEVALMVTGGRDVLARVFDGWRRLVLVACVFGIALRVPALCHALWWPSRWPCATSVAAMACGQSAGGAASPQAVLSAAKVLGAALLHALRYLPYYVLVAASRRAPPLASALLEHDVLGDMRAFAALALTVYALYAVYYLTWVAGWRRFLFGEQNVAGQRGNGDDDDDSAAALLRRLPPAYSPFSPSHSVRRGHIAARKCRTPITAALMRAGWFVDDRQMAVVPSTDPPNLPSEAFLMRYDRQRRREQQARAVVPTSMRIADLIDEEVLEYGERAEYWYTPRIHWMHGTYEDKLRVMRERWAVDGDPGEAQKFSITYDVDGGEAAADAEDG